MSACARGDTNGPLATAGSHSAMTSTRGWAHAQPSPWNGVAKYTAPQSSTGVHATILVQGVA